MFGKKISLVQTLAISRNLTNTAKVDSKRKFVLSYTVTQGESLESQRVLDNAEQKASPAR